MAGKKPTGPVRIADPSAGAHTDRSQAPSLQPWQGQDVVLLTADVSARKTRNGQPAESDRVRVTFMDSTGTVHNVGPMVSLRLARQVADLANDGLIPNVVRVRPYGRKSKSDGRQYSSIFGPFESDETAGLLWQQASAAGLI